MEKRRLRQIIRTTVTAVLAMTVVLGAAQYLGGFGTVNVAGNTSGNIMNRGYAAIQGGWIYYTQGYSGVYKIKADGSGKQKVTDDDRGGESELNVVGGWIYYRVADINGNDGFIYRVKTDGTDKQKLGDDIADCVTVADGWIYYMGQVNITKDYFYHSIFRMKTDGTGRQRLTSQNAWWFSVAGGWIYYNVDASQNGHTIYHIYRMRIDGTGRQELNGDSTLVLAVAGGWVYYQSSNPTDYSGSYLYRMKPNGTGKRRVGNFKISGVNVAGGWVYYREGKTAVMYRVKPNGSNQQKLSEDPVFVINIIGDWIYYIDFNYSDVLYRMKTDGRENQAVK